MPSQNGRPPTERPSRQRSTRDRPPKTPLSEAAVIDAALAILQTEGLDAVTMRRLAAALDTGAASLYVYVDGREGLLQTMLGRVTATIDLERPDPSRWRAQLHEVLQRMHEALVAHPGIAGMTLIDPPTTEPVLRLSDNLLGIMVAGGLDPQDAAWIGDILVALVKAVTSEDDVRKDHEDGDRRAFYTAFFTSLPPDRFPNLSAYSKEMVAGDSDVRLHFAIDAILDGVVSRSAGRASPARGRLR